MLCLLAIPLFPTLLQAAYFPFRNDDLPRERVITIYEATTEPVTIPFHFGPAGTEAWESFFVVYNGFNFFLFDILDCYCGGDAIVIRANSQNVNLQENIFPLIPTDQCEFYSEDVTACLANPDAWASQNYGIESTWDDPVNITLSTLASPYGGGIGFLRYVAITVNDD